MATKKKKKKVGAHRKRKRVSGAGSDLMAFGLRVLGTIAGAGLGAYIIQAGNTALAGQNMPAWAVPAGVAGAGAVIPLIVKKNALAEDFGLGMVAVGGVFAINELGLSIPGIAGLAMSSNAGPANNVLRKAVGCTAMPARVGQAQMNYLNRTVGAHRGSRARMGALMSN